MRATATALVASEFGAFRDHLRGWDVQPIQIEPGPLEITWDGIDLGDLMVGRLRTDRRIIDTTIVKKGHTLFGISLAPISFCGLEIEPAAVMRMTPGRSYRRVSRAGWNSFEIAIADTAWQKRGVTLSGASSDRFDPERSVFKLASTELQKFLAIVDGFYLTMEERSPGEAWRKAATERVQVFLNESMVLARSAGRDSGRRSHVKGYDLTVRALTLIESRKSARMTVSEIARTLDLTVRALAYAFRSTLGLGVYQYLLAYRLNRVRSLLAAPGPGQTVSAAAVTQHFVHLSRFAGAYNDLFGELPSHTLNRGRYVIKENIRPK